MWGEPAPGSQPLAPSPWLALLLPAPQGPQRAYACSPSQHVPYLSVPGKRRRAATWDLGPCGAGTVWSPLWMNRSQGSCTGSEPGPVATGHRISRSWDLQRGLEGGAAFGGTPSPWSCRPPAPWEGHDQDSALSPLWEGYWSWADSRRGELFLESAGLGVSGDFLALQRGLSLPQGLCKMMALSQRQRLITQCLGPK